MSILIISKNLILAQKELQKHVGQQESTTINLFNNVDIINCNVDNLDLSTDDLRVAMQSTNTKPNSLSKKYFIVYNYDRVGERIQNMLLKTIEEGRVTVLLHASNIANILPTTLSRVVVLDLLDSENNVKTKNKFLKIIKLVVEEKQVSRIWSLKKEDIDIFTETLEQYIKENKPSKYNLCAKKLFIFKKRTLQGITLNKDIQLTNLIVDLL